MHGASGCESGLGRTEPIQPESTALLPATCRVHACKRQEVGHAEVRRAIARRQRRHPVGRDSKERVAVHLHQADDDFANDASTDWPKVLATTELGLFEDV